jgi:hypothetical protein
MTPSPGLHCDEVRQRLALLLYGELSFDEEENLHSHLQGCEGCREAMLVERAMHDALQEHGAGQEPPADLLLANRRRLLASVASEPVPQRDSWWVRARQLFAEVTPAQIWRPAAALALLAGGFFAGSAYTERSYTARASSSMLPGVISAQPVSARVRQVDADGSGVLQLVVDETRQRVITGRPDEEGIRRLLLAAAVDPSDAGLRGESVEILRSAAPCDETRAALIQAILHDANDGVRLRALEGLKPYATQPDVRRALAQVLLRDANSGVRTQTIDVLTHSRADINTEIHIVGVFQELMRKESNDYIRMQCQRKLRELKASEEVY